MQSRDFSGGSLYWRGGVATGGSEEAERGGWWSKSHTQPIFLTYSKVTNCSFKQTSEAQQAHIARHVLERVRERSSSPAYVHIFAHLANYQCMCDCMGVSFFKMYKNFKHKPLIMPSEKRFHDSKSTLLGACKHTAVSVFLGLCCFSFCWFFPFSDRNIRPKTKVNKTNRPTHSAFIYITKLFLPWFLVW